MLSLIADSPVKLLAAGKFNKTNIFIGVTRDDGSAFTGYYIPGKADINFILMLR